MSTGERYCLVVDSHPLVRLGVRRLLAERYSVEEAEDGRSALQLVTGVGGFDVAIVDIGRSLLGEGRLSGIGTVRALRRAQPGLGIVAHGARPERHAAVEAIDAGATAYVAKSSPPESFRRAVEAAVEAETFVDPAAGARAATSNVPRLTRRQRQILQMIADGHSTSATAKRLGLSAETVRTHTKAVLARLGARDRAHAVALGLRSSLID
jgi:two-component system, NarL family, response regulator